jgi:hypothetical protein
VPGLIRGWRGRATSSEAADALAAMVGHRFVVVLGDSHAGVFGRIRDQHLLARTSLRVVTVSGATARGLANPNSTTDALARFDAALRTVPRSRRTLVMLGEVDCGFLCWYLADRDQTTVEAQLEVSWARHRRYLEALLADGRRRVGLASVFPPTVEDYATWTGLRNERRQVTASLEERTTLTLAYNARLRRWADQHGCAYLDLDPALIDPATGILRDGFRNPDPTDHHLDPEPLARVVAEGFATLDWPRTRTSV